MEDKGSFKPTVKCNNLRIGPYCIRCMSLLQGNKVSFPPPLINSQGIPLFLACDVMPGNSNMSRISTKYGKLGMAAKFILKDFRLDGYSNVSAMWFFNIHGLFHLAFSHHLKSLQKECLQHLIGLWMKFYDASNFSTETIEVELEESVMKRAMSQFKLNTRTDCDDVKSYQQIATNDHSELHVAENNFNGCEESKNLLCCDQQNVTPKTLLTTPDNLSTDDVIRSDEKSTSKDYVCQCGQKMICLTCDLKSSKNLRTTVNHKHNLRKRPCSTKQIANVDAEKCCLCFQNMQYKSSDITCYQICHTCYAREYSPSTDSNIDPNESQISEVSPKRLCSAKRAGGKDFCSKQQPDSGVEFCDRSSGYGRTVMEEKGIVTQNSELIALPLSELCIIIQQSLHRHLTGEKQLEKCLTLLELLKIHFTAADGNEGFDQDFLKFCCLKMKDPYRLVYQSEDDPGFSKSKFLTIVSMWLGSEFYKCSTIISKRVDDFKQQHINCIDNLPPSNEIVRHIFPVFMSTFLLHWHGFGSDFNEMNETQLTLEHNYINKKLKMDIPQASPNYPLIQLILEFANNALISGVAHVVFSKIKYTK